PQAGAFVILMANRNHPTEAGATRDLRIKVSTLAAEAMGLKKKSVADGTLQVPSAPSAPAGHTANGIDVLEAHGFSELKGLRIGLITNHTGQNLDGKPTIDLL